MLTLTLIHLTETANVLFCRLLLGKNANVKFGMD